MHKDYVDGDLHQITVNYSERSSQIEMNYTEDDGGGGGGGEHINSHNYTSVSKNVNVQPNGNIKKTTFATLPNTTTWQQQQKTIDSINNIHEAPSIPGNFFVLFVYLF